MRAANSHFGKHYINGVWTTPKGAMIDVENPATREIFARVPDGTPEEVDAAVAAAQSAFPRWCSTPLAQRIALMEGMLRRFCEKTEDVIELEVAELGAPVAFARASTAFISKNARPHLLRLHGRLPQKKHSPLPSSCVSLSASSLPLRRGITLWGRSFRRLFRRCLWAARLCSSRANGRRLPPFCSLKPLKRPDFRPGFSILYRDTVKP